MVDGKLKGQVRQKWGKLTDDDLTQLSGKTEHLAGILQQRYGYGKAQAEKEINNWLYELDQPSARDFPLISYIADDGVWKRLL